MGTSQATPTLKAPALKLPTSSHPHCRSHFLEPNKHVSTYFRKGNRKFGVRIGVTMMSSSTTVSATKERTWVWSSIRISELKPGPNLRPIFHRKGLHGPVFVTPNKGLQESSGDNWLWLKLVLTRKWKAHGGNSFAVIPVKYFWVLGSLL